jgi:myo-inositol 2-dehydrogenase/D-chiro-inositol 1-dehydrogenase
MHERETTISEQSPAGGLTRRHFLGNVAATAASASLLGAGAGLAAEQPAAAPKPPARKIKLGWIGCGGRGAWLAGLFLKHGGYEIHAVADYFPDLVDQGGETLGVPKARRFAGLSGCKKVLESGVEALGVLDVPCFYPEQAHAALAAGCHVYMAKPVAVDVPGCLAIEAAGKLATQKKLSFLVDYQMPTDPINIEIAKRIWDGGMGRLLAVSTLGGGGATALRADQPKGKTIESRLRGLVWCSDIPLGGDLIVNFDIHSIDAAVWAIRRRPIAAMGYSRICRKNPLSDCRDLCFVTYECPDGLLWSHQSFNIPDHGRSLVANIHGELASAQISYWGKSFLRGGSKHFGGGEVASLYDQGANRNIADFYRAIVEGQCDNPTVQRAVDGTLTAILGREAAARGTRLTMEQLIQENRKLEVDLSGLKV